MNKYRPQAAMLEVAVNWRHLLTVALYKLCTYLLTHQSRITGAVAAIYQSVHHAL